MISEFFSQISNNLHELKQTEHYQALNARAHMIVNAVLMLTVLLEIWSLPTVKLLLTKQPNGRELYLKALFWNVFNQYALAIQAFSIAGTILTRSGPHLDWKQPNHHHTVFVHLAEILWLWAIHSIGYYQVHKAFHLSPRWYKYHKFHHRFNSYVPPSASNAVEAMEYLLAYLLPFLLALTTWPPFLLIHPKYKIHSESLALATSIVSVLNLWVHTPKLEGTYMSKSQAWTRWFVSTEDHLNHHRKLKCHYAAPTFNVDNIFDSLSSALSSSLGTTSSKGPSQ